MDSEDIGLSNEEIMSKLSKFEQMADRINRLMEFCQPPNSEVETFQKIDKVWLIFEEIFNLEWCKGVTIL